jgi:hypothetical protein
MLTGAMVAAASFFRDVAVFQKRPLRQTRLPEGATVTRQFTRP